jgi:hypothetical protein
MKYIKISVRKYYDILLISVNLLILKIENKISASTTYTSKYLPLIYKHHNKNS